jgi:Zn-finger nucleic acid-binding protein
MVINLATHRWDEALKSYADCDWSEEELLANIGVDDIVNYIGKEELYISNRIRADKNVEFGFIAYNYGRDGYDIYLDSRRRIELQEGDGFEVWHDGKWKGTKILYDGEKKCWGLWGMYGEVDIAFEELRVRGYIAYNSEDYEKEKRESLAKYKEKLKEIRKEKRRKKQLSG